MNWWHIGIAALLGAWAGGLFVFCILACCRVASRADLNEAPLNENDPD